MPSEVNANLRQQGSFGIQREFQIVDGRNIHIGVGNKAKLKIYKIPILALAEKSRQRLHIAWTWAWLAIACIGAMPLYLLIKPMFGLAAHNLDIAVLGSLLVVAIISLIMVLINFSRKRVFYTAFSKVPLFDIKIGKPDYRSYKHFLQQLEMYMEKSRSFWDLRADQQVAGELRMLRRLANEGLIPQKLYESAKGKMMKVNNARARATG